MADLETNTFVILEMENALGTRITIQNLILEIEETQYNKPYFYKVFRNIFGTNYQTTRSSDSTKKLQYITSNEVIVSKTKTPLLVAIISKRDIYFFYQEKLLLLPITNSSAGMIFVYKVK
jgi:hypothetical protein